MPLRIRELAVRYRVELALAVLLALPVWTADPLPLMDLPLHEQEVALLVHGRDWSGWPDALAFDPTPRPYAVVYFLWAGLAHLVGVGGASRLLLTYTLAAGFLAGVYLVRRLDPAKRWASLLVGLLAYSEWHYLGFVPQQLAMPAAFVLLGRRAPDPDPEREGRLDARRDLVDALLLLSCYLCHPLMGFFTGLTLLPFAARAKRPLRALARLVAVGLPCVLWAAGVAALGAARPLQPDLPLAWPVPWKVALLLAAYPLAPHGWFLFWQLGGPARGLGLACLLAWGLGLACLRWGEPQITRARPRGLTAALLLLLALLFAFPHSLQNGSALSVRALALLFPLLLGWAPARAEGPRARPLALLALAVTLLTGLAAHHLAAREARALDPLLEAMAPRAAVLPPNPPVLRSQVLRGLHLDAHLNALCRYHARQGGVGPPPGVLYLSTSPVWAPRPLPPWPDPSLYRYVVRHPDEPTPAGFAPLPVAGPLRLLERRGGQ